MKRIWVKIDPWDKKMVTTALEGGADAVVVPKGHTDKVKALGKITTVSDDGDLKIGKDVIFFDLKSGDQEQEIVRLSREKQVILQCSDWTIIPLENLIAKGADVIAQVETLEDAATAFGILEAGVKCLLFHPKSAQDLKHALSALSRMEMKTSLDVAQISEIRQLGMGDRVCVDTCTSMSRGQGMLVGNSSNALFLIHAESVSNPYVAPRPFRVNAGPVHAYTRVPDGKTRYLSELQGGDSVLLVDYTGKTTVGVVGRLKIERRPLMLIVADYKDRRITTIVQNAETIRLTTPEGEPISVVALKPGDKVLVACEEGARHFGHKIEETIMEK